MELSVILATTSDNVIGMGKENKHYSIYSKFDMVHFKSVTTYSPNGRKNLLIVGRKTFDTFPESMLKCSYRDYIILSKTIKNTSSNNIIVSDFEHVLEYCMKNRSNYYKIFAIGGAEIYRLVME